MIKPTFAKGLPDTFFGRKTASLFVLFFDNKNPENKLKVNYLTFILIVGEKIVPQG